MKASLFFNKLCFVLVLLFGAATVGRAQQPYQKAGLGITFGEVTKAQPGAKAGEGAMILEVAGKSVAEVAGIKPNDIITKVNDTSVKNAAQLNSLLKPMVGGSNLAVTVLRNGETLTRRLTLAARPAPAPAPLRDASGNIVDEDDSTAPEKDNEKE